MVLSQQEEDMEQRRDDLVADLDKVLKAKWPSLESEEWNAFARVQAYIWSL